MTFRVSDTMREWLVQAAEANGRSVSEEIEYQLLTYRNREAFVGELVRRKTEKIADEVWDKKNRQLVSSYLSEVIQSKADNIKGNIEILIKQLEETRLFIEELGAKPD